ncbi:hypothetical protein [Olsenella uli]|uniref:hypothetical protein n=1 Tax=Olsenella uli TaxID=133926 RepID=UPI0004503C87|nr:hypothetical protein [Olsenella uli]EUB32627.1 putative lipoprotein [Olsenella uli MSTE5]
MRVGKAAVAGLGIAMALTLGACGGQAQQDAAEGGKEQETQAQAPATQKDFDGAGQSEVGEGTAMLYTQAGTTEGGNVPKLTLPKDTQLYQIELDTDGLDGSAVTYVYVDGMENTKGNYGRAQASLTLQKDALKTGRHTVEVVQFQGDEVGGTVTFYRSMGYEIAN